MWRDNLKLASFREVPIERTVISVGELEIGRQLVVIAGPCSVESEKQTIRTAQKVKEAGSEYVARRGL